MTATLTHLEPEPTRGRRVGILAVVLVSYFMILLDNSVIFTSLPSLEADLRLSDGALAWVQDAYTLVFGGLLLLGARAGDILGRRRVFVFGLVVFSIASLLIGLALADWWIIGARALQGVGAAIVAPSALSLITANFPAGRERNRALALYSATAGIGASLGLVVGGALTAGLSWRAGFFVNVPVGIAMIVLAPRVLPSAPGSRGRLDVVGALCATLGMGALVFAILTAAETSWTSPLTIGGLIVGVALLVLLVLRESRAPQPILPLGLFASRVRVGGYVARLLYLGAMIGFFFFTTQYLQEALGFDPLQAGLGFLPMTVLNFVVAVLAPRLIARIGDGIPLVVGVGVSLAGMIWLSRIGPGSDYLLAVGAPLVLVGIGQGLVFAPLTAAGLAGTTAVDAGAASGLVNTFHQLGMSLGLGILSAVALSAARGDDVAAVSSQVSAALTAGAVLLALSLAAAAALILPSTLPRTTESR